jgi:tight adherence protein C
MTALSIVVVVFVILLAVGCFIFTLTMSKNEKILKDRLEEMSDNKIDIIEDKVNIKDLPLGERLVRPYVLKTSELMQKFLPQNTIDMVEKKLIVAGNPGGLTPTTFLGQIGFIGVVCPAIATVFFIIAMKQVAISLLLGGFLSAVLIILQVNKISTATKARKKSIVKNLPFALDLLTISVDAGLGFDSAVDKVVLNMDGPISDEFKRLLAEMRIGKPRKDALREMIDRTEVEELSEFVVAIIQADQLGIGLSKLLKVQAKQMRIKARQKAQEQANKAPVKMLIPMVMFIFPCIFAVLLGGAVFTIMDSLSMMGG